MFTNYFNGNYFDFLWVMTEKELKARYKNTFFGFLWVFINPLLQMLVIGFVFRFFLKEPIQNYYLYLITGLVIWNFLSLTLTKTTPSVVNERSLIKKARFPREVIPLSIIFSNLINMFLSLILILIPVVFKGTYSTGNLYFLVSGTLMLILFSIGTSLLTSALNVRYRDINFIIQALLIVWFYATPIVYSIDFIPHDLIWLWRLNPMVSVVQSFQAAMVSAAPPGPAMIMSNLLITISILLIGIVVFNRESRNFDDWI